jgi:hypothetical protein
MFNTITKLLTKVSTKIFDDGDTTDGSNISEILRYKQIDLCSKDLDEYLSKLRKKHLVNDIIVTDVDGIVIGTTSNNLKDGFRSAAMYNYINSETKNLSIILIEADGWQIIFKFEKKVYFVRANDSLSRIEVQAIIKDIENYLNCMVYK